MYQSTLSRAMNQVSVCPHITNPETASLKDECRKMKSTAHSLSYLPQVYTWTIYNLFFFFSYTILKCSHNRYKFFSRGISTLFLDLCHYTKEGLPSSNRLHLLKFSTRDSFLLTVSCAHLKTKDPPRGVLQR